MKWTRRWDTGRIWHPADTISQLLYYHVVGVELYGDGVSDSSLADLQGLPYLKSLTIPDAPRITDACIPALIAIDGLQWLRLSGTAVTKEGAAELKRALPGCQITWDPEKPMPAISEHIADRHSREYSGLRVVTMRGPTIDDATLATLSNLGAIGRLTISEAPLVTDTGVEHLCCASKLKGLVLHGTAVTAAGVSKLQEALPDCKIERLPPGPYRERRQSLPWWWRLVGAFDPASG